MTKSNIPHLTREKPIDEMGRFSNAWSRFFIETWNRIGGGKSYNLGGTLYTDTTPVGNIGGGEDDLITYALEKNILQNAGDRLEIEAFGTTAANVNNKTIKFYFGSDVLFDTSAKGLNSSHWYLNAVIIRKSATTQLCVATFHSDATIVTNQTDYTDATQDLTTSITIKCTGTSAGSATDDIIQKALIINFYPG